MPLKCDFELFERELTANGDPFHFVISLFRTFKGADVARRYPELYQGFPPLGVPATNIGNLTDMMQVPEAEMKVLKSLCQSRLFSHGGQGSMDVSRDSDRKQ